MKGIYMAIITWIISTIIGVIVTAAIWKTLEEFLCAIIKKVLPERYGEQIEKYVKKIVGIVRKVYNYAELACEVMELVNFATQKCQNIVIGTKKVEWSEVPIDIKDTIKNKGEYRYEYSD